MLEYIEDRYITEKNIKYIDKSNIHIENICPASSGTIAKQNEVKDGLTIVTVLEKDYSNKIQNIIDIIDNLGYNFIPTKRLHCTLLDLSSSSNLLGNKYNETLLIDAIPEFFNEIYNSEINFKLNFECIRPGTWYGLNQNPIPNASDGTVVLYGNYNDNGNKDFVDCGVNLAKVLRNKLPSIFEKFDRNFPTIWVTLGYFNHKDFQYNKDKNFETIFNKFRQVNSELSPINVKELRLVKYTKRSLEDAQILFKIY